MPRSAFENTQNDPIEIHGALNEDALIDELTERLGTNPKAPALHIYGVHDSYFPEGREKIAGLIDNLPVSTAKVLFDDCQWHHDDLQHFVSAISNRRTVQITSCRLSEHPQWQDILTTLSKRNPNLTTLRINHNGFERNEQQFNAMCQLLITLFPNLQELSITIPKQASLSMIHAIQDLCGKHPKLQKLQVPGLQETQQQELLPYIQVTGHKPDFEMPLCRQFRSITNQRHPLFGASVRHQPYPIAHQRSAGYAQVPEITQGNSEHTGREVPIMSGLTASPRPYLPKRHQGKSAEARVPERNGENTAPTRFRTFR